jgi:ABC-type branched-subunit amino acid transport system permease subunit
MAWFSMPEDLQTGSVFINSIRRWLITPQDFRMAGNIAYVVTILLVMASSRIKSEIGRLVLIIATVYTLVMAWELRMSNEPSVTRLIVVGLMLVLLMIYRPNGLLGTRRVEIV